MAEEQFDLILTGLQSDDQGHAQFGPVLAERLGVPHSTIIMEVQVDAAAKTLRVKRELEGGWFQYVGDAAAGAADDPERHQPAALRDAEGHHGGEEEGDQEGRRRPRRVAAPASASALYAPQKAKQTVMIGGSAAEAAKELVTRLREEARVL